MAKILQVSARAGMAHVIEPVARWLLRRGVTPNMVTVAGSVGAVASAIAFGVSGYLFVGAVVVTLFALTDLLDGTMARLSGGSTRFGALLDSTMDRVVDAAVIGTVLYIFARAGDLWGVVAATLCLVTGALVSYVKARAEGLGMTANVGVAERAERLIVVGVGALFFDLFGLSWALSAAMWILAAISTLTVGQRMTHVYRQARALDAAGAGPGPGGDAARPRGDAARPDGPAVRRAPGAADRADRP
jgi:CDP-diacylglycerol--glycerol-3-phosphate 3-phosphatidyltransferase